MIAVDTNVVVRFLTGDDVGIQAFDATAPAILNDKLRHWHIRLDHTAIGLDHSTQGNSQHT